MTTLLDSFWPYQRRALRKAQALHNKALLAGEVGTGKTRISVAVVEEANFLRILVITPVSSLFTWDDEITTLGIKHPVLTLSGGSSTEKAKQVAAFGNGYIITNYETFWRSALFVALKAWGPDYIIADEAQKLRNRTSKQSKEAFKAAQWPTVKARLGASGTPATRGRENMFGIYRFIDPNVFGTNWRRFADQYLVEVNMGDYNKIVGYKNTTEFDHKVDTTSIQIAKSDALPWLPKERDVFKYVEFDRESRRRYKEFAAEAVADITGRTESGELREGVALARIALTTLVRLQQLTSGFIKTVSEGELIVSDEKLGACLELTDEIMDADKSVVVFYKFSIDRRRLEEALNKRYPGQVATLHGKMKAAEQRAALQAFKSKRARILLCQIQKAIGVNQMVAASDAIFYSISYSLEELVQAKGRIHRPGQTQPVTYYHLVMRNTVDVKLYTALAKKMDIAAQFIKLDYVKGFLSGD